MTAFPVRLDVQQLSIGDVNVSGLHAGLEEGELALRVERIAASAEWRVDDVALDCRADSSGAMPCSSGEWSLRFGSSDAAGPIPLAGELESVARSAEGWTFSSSVVSGALRAHARASTVASTLSVRVDWRDQQIAGLGQLPLPAEMLRWVTAGRTSGSLALELEPDTPLRAECRASLEDLTFDSPEGRFAAAGFGATFSGSLGGGSPRIAASATVTGGELLIDNFYAAFAEAPLQLSIRAVAREGQLRVESLKVSDGRALELAASASLRPEAPLDTLDYRIEHLELHFPIAYERYLETLLAPLTLDGLSVTGSVLWRGSGGGGRFPEGELDVVDLSVVDNRRERFAVTGLEAALRVGHSPSASRIGWRGLLLQRINLGSGGARIDARPGSFALAEPLRLDVLGGDLTFERLEVLLPPDDAPPEAEPEIKLQASLHDMEMVRLTDALGWPRFEGRISGMVPGVTLEAGVLAVDGQIEFDVFDGRLRLSGLRIERPFGVLPSLAADLEVEDVDLELFTRAFSFGRISGRMDGYMRELRMLDWKPVAFDAWFGTPADQKSGQAISRQAVNHLTTIGGGGATTALAGPLLGLFNNFSYRRLGIGCRLQNNVCRLRGLEDDGDSVLIMEGAGIPKLMIRAYNRRMDFPQLVANLKAATEGEGVRIGDGP